MTQTKTADMSPPVGAVPEEARPKTRSDALAAAIKQALPPEALASARRSIWWQCRKGLYPVGVGVTLWGGAAGLHDAGANPAWVPVGAVALAAVGLAVTKVRRWVSRKTWRKAWSGGALAAAAVYTTAGVQAGAGLDTPMPTLMLIGVGILGAPWWFINRPTAGLPVFAPMAALEAAPAVPVEEAAPQEAEKPSAPVIDLSVPHEHQIAYDGHVGAKKLKGSSLVEPKPIIDHNDQPNGVAWTLDGGPDKHTYATIRNALDDIKAALDRPQVDNLIHMEQHPEGWKTRARVVVLETNPLVQEILWEGPRLITEKGLVPFAVYPDGSGWAHYVLYRPGWGTPHDLISGVTGSGKSTAMRLIIAESICGGRSAEEVEKHGPSEYGSAMFIFDPHGGASFQEALPKVTRAFLNPHEIYAGARGLYAAQQERLNVMREVGEKKVGPEYGYPIIHSLFDEASNEVVLGNPDINAIILGGVQEGRKLWMKWTLAMQRPSGDAFDDNTDAREQLLGGNVLAYRVATPETARMLNTAGLNIEPHLLPHSFDAAGEIPTTGLGFILGANRRELVSRTIHAKEEAFTRYVPAAAQLDERTAEAFERGYAEAMVEIEMQLEEEGKPRKAAESKPKQAENVRPMVSQQMLDQTLGLFRERGRLTPKEIHEAGVCALSHAYRVCEALESDGLVANVAGGVWELKAS